MTVVDDIKARLDILEVVGQRVQLQRSGRSFKGNCPFHQERTPSFHVFPDRQTWRCFGACATGGDAVGFVMRSEGLEFREAIRQLAQQVGLPMPDRQGSRAEDPTFQMNEAACAFFQRTLASTQGSDARAYMERRGLDRAASDAFQIGLAPSDGTSLREHMVRQGFDPGRLVAAGLVREGDDGQQRDLFRGRLIIPIRDAEGRLAGFGGRALDDSEPKYLNSPQSEVFDKSRLLYAMDLARDNIRKEGAVIVEGYMDAIAAHQAGFRNVVASMGTALTEPQVNTIRRLTDRVTMALDQDTAGQQATRRGLDSSWRVFQRIEAGRSGRTQLFQSPDVPEIKVAVMPQNQDPDEVIRNSPREWVKLIEQAVPLLEFVITAWSSDVDVSNPRGKAEVAQHISPLIFAVQDAPQQDLYFRMLAEKLEVPLDTLRASVIRPAGPQPRRRSAPNGSPPAAAEQATASPFARLDHDPLEEYCLALLLRYPDLGEFAETLTAEVFQRLENREIFSGYLPAVSLTANEDMLDGHFLEAAPEGVRERLEALRQRTLLPMDLVKRRRAIEDVVARLEERSIRQQKRDEQDRFADSADDLSDEDHRAAAALNERLKRNERTRPSVRSA